MYCLNIKLKMNELRFILSDYFNILEGNLNARYLQCKYIPVSFDSSDSIDSLWRKHDSALKKMNVSGVEPEHSLIDLKIEIANRIFHCCSFCERRCLVDREKTSGECNVMMARIVSEFLHFGEETVLIPSHTIFFSGCTFQCVFCQNWDISQKISGFYVEPEKLANIISKRRSEGARNVNWVGGDPTPNLPYILKVLKELNVNVPQIWNSNMYCSKETMNLLNGIIDVYLTDFKFGNDDCAKELSKVDNYIQIIKRNHKIAYNQGEIIVRHLILPSHVMCCSKHILEWISNEIPEVAVNLMDQYRSEYRAYEYVDLRRSILKEEYTQVKDFAEKLKIHVV